MSGRMSAVWILCLLAIALGLDGCQVGGPEKGQQDGAGDGPVADPEQKPPPAREVVVQQICRLQEASPALETCPEVTDAPATWTVRPLFDDGSGSWTTWRALPEALKRYCLYSGQGEFPDEKWRKANGLECRLDEELVAPLQTAGDKELIGAFTPAFENGAGRPTKVPTQATPTVRLAVLDGFEDTSPPVDVGSHGGTLYHIARDLLCEELHTPNVECAAEVTTGVALPVEVVPGDPSAGHVGRPSDLVHAIYGAVGPWGGTAAYDALVINLSLGWDPQHGGMATGWKEITPENVTDHAHWSAVYDALHYAQCSGALTFAAVGNQTVLGETGPLVPAVWGSEAYRPAALFGPGAECQTRFGPAMDAANDTRPLLYPVGAVDDDDSRLAIAREDSEPEAVAYGAHGTVEARGLPTTPMSGTSLSTLVVSSAAVLLWSQDTGTTPQAVYEGILPSGDLGRMVTDWFEETPLAPGDTKEVRLVKLCGPKMPEPCPAQGRAVPAYDLAEVTNGLDVVETGACQTQVTCKASVGSEWEYATEAATCLVSELQALRSCTDDPPDPLPDLCNHVIGMGGVSVLKKPVLFPMPPGRRCPYCLTVANGADPLLVMKTTDVQGEMFNTELVLKDVQGVILHVVDLGTVKAPQNSVVQLPAYTNYADVSRSVLSGLHKVDGNVSPYVSLVQVTH